MVNTFFLSEILEKWLANIALIYNPVYRYLKGRGEAWREAILAKLRLNVLFPKPPEERCFQLEVAVYGHKVSDLDGDWRPSGPGPCILPVRALGPEVTPVGRDVYALPSLRSTAWESHL